MCFITKYNYTKKRTTIILPLIVNYLIGYDNLIE